MQSKVVIIFITQVVRPLATYFIRLARGEYKSEHERLIVETFKAGFIQKLNDLMRTRPAT